MNHDSILKFIAAEKHGDNLNTEFWLITAFHELGSLHDFLKSNTVSWEELCYIAYTLARYKLLNLLKILVLFVNIYKCIFSIYDSFI